MKTDKTLCIEEAIEHLDNILSDKDRWNRCEECKKEHEQLREWLEELQQYRQIGTVDECREAMERMIPKKPVVIEMQNTCPNCSCNIHRNYWNCKECGQTIDWGK